MSHGMSEEKIRATAINISMRLFERIAEILMRDELVADSIKIPDGQFVFADAIAEYIRTGKHPDVPMVTVDK
jgi:hypothetical protein